MLSTKRGYYNFTKPEYKQNVLSFTNIISFGIEYNDDYINFVAYDCISALIQPNTQEIDLATEQRNKTELLSGPSWQTIFSQSFGTNLVLYAFIIN